ncbi:hypothetical protein TNCV_397851 [Trichonephila clavipes]|nr:hypothetical protein TNCV_397851 [Trichonephila clavipes]
MQPNRSSIRHVKKGKEIVAASLEIAGRVPHNGNILATAPAAARWSPSIINTEDGSYSGQLHHTPICSREKIYCWDFLRELFSFFLNAEFSDTTAFFGEHFFET